LPGHEEHCQHTLKRYGVRGDDVHSFLDEPCRIAGKGHRQFRHDSETVKLVGQIFGKKYGRELAENIALDHIMLDHKEEIRKRRDNAALSRCPNCGAPLGETQKGKRICKYCGYEVEVLESLREESIKLPGRNRWLLLFRQSNDDTLPIALPPLEIEYPPRVIDEVYLEFDNKEEVLRGLEILGYSIMTVEDFRMDGFTDSEIRKLVLESKKVTSQQINELLEKAKEKAKLMSEQARWESIPSDAQLKKKLVREYILLNLLIGIPSAVLGWDIYVETQDLRGFIGVALLSSIIFGVFYIIMWLTRHTREHNPPRQSPREPTACFIATAAYGTPVAKEIEVLRDFRDKKLESTHLGRQMVLFYYRTSPPIGEIISRSERMRTAVRYALYPIIDALKKKNSRNTIFQDISHNTRRKKSRRSKTCM